MRNAGGTVDFIGTSLGYVPTNEFLFTQAPAQQGDSSNFGIGILPYGIVNGSDFATYQFNNAHDPSITGIGAFNDYAPSISGAVHTGDTVKETSIETLTGNTTINALLLGIANPFGATAQSGTVGEAGFTLTIASGGLLDAAPAGAISGGTLAFGGPFTGDPTNEGIVMNGETAGGLDVSYWDGSGENANTFPNTVVGFFNQMNFGREAPLYTRIDPTINYPSNTNGTCTAGHPRQPPTAADEYTGIQRHAARAMPTMSAHQERRMPFGPVI